MKHINRFGYAFILMMFGLAAYVLYLHSIIIFSCSPNIGGMEEVNVYYSKILRVKGTLYFDPHHFPYSQTLYTPIYFYLTNLIQDLLQIPLEQVWGYYQTGRVLNLAFICLSVVTLLMTARTMGIPAVFGFFSACFFLLHVPEHSLAVRPDAMKDFLFILTLWMLTKYQRTLCISCWLLSILFSMLAVYVKQDALIHLAALWGSFAVLYRRKWYILGLALFIPLTLLVAVIAQHVTNGLFFDNIIFSNVEFSIDFLHRWWRDVKTVGIFSFIPVVLIAYTFLRSRDNELRNWAIISFIFGLIAMLISIKFGAAINYFTTYFIVLGIAVGLALKALYLSSSSSLLHKGVLVLMAVILISNLPAANRLKYIHEDSDPHKLESVGTVSHHILDTYPGKRVLALDQAFIPFLPYETIFKGFHLIFSQLLFSKYGFEGAKDLLVYSKADTIQLQKIKDEVDVLVLEDNPRSEKIYKESYAQNFYFKESIGGYNIYLKK